MIQKATAWLLTATTTWILLSLPLAAADIRHISDLHGLNDALAAPSEDMVLELAPGEYGDLSLRGFSARNSVIIRSAKPEKPARLSAMTLRDVAGITFENLVFDYDFQTGDKLNLRPFQILDSQRIVIRGALFEGDVARGYEASDNGFPTAFGLGVRNSSDITLENSEIRNFFRATVMSQSKNLTVTGNDIHGIRMDGMNFAEVQGVRIEGNHIHDFKRSLKSKDHADMIQFWTNRTKSPSHNIVIRNNVLNSGKGWFTQSIFMRNDLVDRGLAGPEMFYRDITIENNLIINAHLHGITVGETNGLFIRNNTVVRNATSEGKRKSPGLWIPQIRAAEASHNVEIVRNVTHTIKGVTTQPDWQVSDNFFVQDNARSKSGFYGDVFGRSALQNPTQARSFLPKTGGTLDDPNIGAHNLLQ
jgi:hypothetical protein